MAATMAQANNIDFGGNIVRRMLRELAELKEMAKLGAAVPGDVQRMARIRTLVAQSHEAVRRVAIRVARPD